MTRMEIAVAAAILLLAGWASAEPEGAEELIRPTTELDAESLGALPERPDHGLIIRFQSPGSSRRRYRDLRAQPFPPGESPYDLYLHMLPEALLEEIGRAWELLRGERYPIVPDFEAELLLRLGIAYEEYARHLRGQELESYHHAMEACRSAWPEDCGDAVEPSFVESRSFEATACLVYRDLVWRFPDHYTVDEAAWRLENLLAALQAG